MGTVLLNTGVLFCCALLYPALVNAQGVYVTRGENGPVFSDKPQSGGKEVSLRPLTVVPPTKEVRSEAKAANAPVAAAVEDGRAVPSAPPGYRRFAIVFPEDGASVASGNGSFDLRMALEPALQADAGHGFIVSVNGRVLAQRFTTSELVIPLEFWSGVFPPSGQPVRLEASLVDANGQVLKRAPAVQFYLHYALPGHKARPLPPRRPPFPPPKPPVKEKKASDADFGSAVLR